MPVKAVNVKHIAPGDWTADITFGIPNDGAHDDPTITLNSGEGVELPPKVGDIMLVRPPEIVGYANVQAHTRAGAENSNKATDTQDETKL